MIRGRERDIEKTKRYIYIYVYIEREREKESNYGEEMILHCFIDHFFIILEILGYIQKCPIFVRLGYNGTDYIRHDVKYTNFIR